jgi:hypothetical protein
LTSRPSAAIFAPALVAALQPGRQRLSRQPAVRVVDRARQVPGRVGGGAARVDQDEVGGAVLQRGADVVGVGLDREAVREVLVGDLGLRHAPKRGGAVDRRPVT